MEMMRERVLKELEKLTPEQRMEVWRTAWSVLKMPAEKKKEIIGMDDQRRRRVREEIEKAIKDNGIEMDDARKREFFGRYFQGRREIEVQILKENESRRQTLMRELAEKLKAEFARPAEEQKAEGK